MVTEAPQRIELPIAILWFEFVNWVFLKTNGIPKKFRFTVADRILNSALNIAELLVAARWAHRKLETLNGVNSELEKLRLLVRIAYENRLLAQKDYLYAAEKMVAFGNQLGAWIKLQSKKELNQVVNAQT